MYNQMSKWGQVPSASVTRAFAKRTLDKAMCVLIRCESLYSLGWRHNRRRLLHEASAVLRVIGLLARTRSGHLKKRLFLDTC